MQRSICFSRLATKGCAGGGGEGGWWVGERHRRTCITTEGNGSPAEVSRANTPGTTLGSARSAWKGYTSLVVVAGLERETVATRYPAPRKPLTRPAPTLEPAPKMRATREEAMVSLLVNVRER